MSEAESVLYLRDVIEQEAETLQNTLRHYVLRAGLATNCDLDMIAGEILSEVVVEALRHADRLDRQRDPVPWLLGIAANLIRRRCAALRKRDRREPLISDLCARSEQWSESDLFDRISRLSVRDPATDLESREEMEYLLSLVSNKDRAVLKLAILNGLSGDALASALDTSPGAARVRLHRAIQRLRAALQNHPLD